MQVAIHSGLIYQRIDCLLLTILRGDLPPFDLSNWVILLVNAKLDSWDAMDLELSLLSLKFCLQAF